MGKMKELAMQIREKELGEAEHQHLDDEYWYQQYIQEKHKSPKNVCFMHDSEGALVMLQGETEEEIMQTASKHHLEGEFMIMKPEKHLFL
jgi:phosphoserine aminotransferase